jgi:hypothetical protein
VGNSGPQATVEISTARLGFGSVAVGSTSTVQDVTLVNNGNTPVTIEAITVTNPDFALSGAPRLPQSLGSGQSLTVNLVLTPTSLGRIVGLLKFQSGKGTEFVILSGAGKVGLHAASLNGLALAQLLGMNESMPDPGSGAFPVFMGRPAEILLPFQPEGTMPVAAPVPTGSGLDGAEADFGFETDLLSPFEVFYLNPQLREESRPALPAATLVESVPDHGLSWGERVDQGGLLRPLAKDAGEPAELGRLEGSGTVAGVPRAMALALLALVLVPDRRAPFRPDE